MDNLTPASRLSGRGVQIVRGEPLPNAVTGGVPSAFGEPVTKLATAVQSGQQTVETSLGAPLDGLTPQNIPQRISIGSEKMCLHYEDHNDCHLLPIQIAATLPPLFKDMLADHILRQFQHIVETLQSVVLDPIIVTIVLTALATVCMLGCRLFYRYIRPSVVIAVFTILVLGSFACAILSITSVYVLQARFIQAVNDIPALSVQSGVDGALCLGTLAWAVIMVLASCVSLSRNDARP